MIVGHLAAPWRRGRRLRWGARPDEPPSGLPGDDLLSNPSWQYTHAISVQAPPERVWPWVVQLGQGRGGFYSFERLENLFGCQLTNADVVHPSLQELAVGDEIRLHPTAPALHVAVVEPGRSLVLRGTPVDEPSSANDNVWAFHLLPDGVGRCRLLECGRTVHGSSWRDRLFFSTLLVEPIGFVMGREMLQGIKERAESPV